MSADKRRVARKKKVAIVGGGPSRRLAPYNDSSWEIWAFSSRLYRYPRVTRWFELHAITDLRQQLATKRPGRRSFPGYMRYMRRLNCPVYMQKRHPGIPKSVPFPAKRLRREFGRCFTSTASYLIALAIVEGYDTIGLWGIDVRRKEYLRQKPAIRYLLSVARQRGIEVQFAPGCAIRLQKTPRRVTTRVLYAYDWRSRHAWWRDRVRRRQRRFRVSKGRIRRR